MGKDLDATSYSLKFNMVQAGRYEVVTREVEGVSISTYLFADHAKHAAFILDQVGNYIRIYNEVLGPYPWPKFDVVENFFTTGYGMPTYTLLGANVVEVNHGSSVSRRHGPETDSHVAQPMA